jgi:DNA polymerase III subunit delta
MKSQLFLFSGDNTFETHEELLRWKKTFIEKHGEANWQRMTGREVDWRELLDEVSTAPFLSEKRLIVIDGMPPKIEKDDLELLVKEMHPSTVVVFIESAPDKRKAVTKFLLKNATVKTFGKNTPKQLVSWLIALAKERGAELSSAVASHLVAFVGTDQWHLKNELLKLLSYIPSKPSRPSTDDVNRICLPSQKHTVWLMSDLIGRGQTEEAVELARSLHESGEDAYSLWNIFLWIMKNLVTLWIHMNAHSHITPSGPIEVRRTESGVLRGNITSLAKETGIPYPGVQSLLPCAAKFSHEKMSALVSSVVEADEALKTGKVKATAGEPIELVAMLERQLFLTR